MPSMSRPVQQQRRQVEYATKADVEILAAEVHGFREATEAEIRGLREATEAEIRALRESTKADVEVLAAEIRGSREATKAEIRALRESTDARLNVHDQTLERIERTLERIDQRFDDQNARHKATVRWIIGAVLTLGGLILAALRFG